VSGAPADTLFVGGRVFAATGDRPVAAGVAVRDGKVAAVAPDDALRELAGPATDVVDLDGGLLTPGFQDAHVHPVFAGALLLQCDLQDAAGPQDLLARVSAYAAAHPGRDWVVGGGWSMEAFPGGRPHREELDAVVPDRPVYLTNRDGHAAWVNTAALHLAGVHRDTADPRDGRIERDADGAPTGLLHEGAAMLVGRLLPAATEADSRAALLAAQKHLLSLGVTAWQDAIVGPYLGRPDNLSTYLAADAAGELVVRVVGDLWWDRERGLEQLPELRERRASGPAGRFRPTTVKIMQDGVAESFTAAMTAPYRDACGCRTSNSGLSFVEPELLRRAVTALDADGFQVHLHTLGDRAVREALDAVEAARAANGSHDRRHHLAHLQVVHPDDVPRFAGLDVTATIQPLWAVHEPQMDELTIPFLGEGLAERQYPFADLHAAGARLAAGSDWAVSSADPWAGLHVAVNRTPPDPDGPPPPPFLPEQRLSLATALTAYTRGSARVNRLDDVTGTLEVGKDADLVVHDRDPFAGPPGEIGLTRVRRTYVHGRLVHEADGVPPRA
jgi:predicted amidohydrolase YtcJ